mmetsp:Transcript_9548/g.34786  ORF Transcript_9548/g.34786 Transcript_9548/m.34786 type:complete len:201 (-) Transcript_9548:1108-1710(-)
MRRLRQGAAHEGRPPAGGVREVQIALVLRKRLPGERLAARDERAQGDVRRARRADGEERRQGDASVDEDGGLHERGPVESMQRDTREADQAGDATPRDDRRRGPEAKELEEVAAPHNDGREDDRGQPVHAHGAGRETGEGNVEGRPGLRQARELGVVVRPVHRARDRVRRRVAAELHRVPSRDEGPAARGILTLTYTNVT